MAFNSDLNVEGQAVVITLAGELDASAAPEFRDRVEEAAKHSPQRLVLKMEDLSYMASAGLRTLVFAKQKMGPDVDIYVVGVQEPVRETIELTGFHHSVIMVESYDEVAGS
jgi:anti-anti-sigma factor